MKIDIKIDESIKERRIEIFTEKLDNEIDNLIKILNATKDFKLKAFLDEELFLLSIDEIDNLFAEDKKIYCISNGKRYLIKERLYEVEKYLPNNFIRISNSEIVNFNEVISVNLKIIGSLVLTLKSGEKLYSSRRYIKKIKEYLEI